MMVQVNKEFIHQKYIVERLTQKEIGTLIGCSGSTILRRMRKYNIPVRSKSEITSSQWATGVYAGNAEQISQQHKNGQRTEVYKKISKGLKQHFSNPENRIRIQGKKSHLWKGKTPRICETCGEPFEVYPSVVKRDCGRFCSTACQLQWQSETFVGENSPTWLGGATPYPVEFNKTFKKAIRKRDNFTCHVCGKKENGRAHDVHHINYIKADTTPENCITLCLRCHRVTNFNRDYWQSKLSELQKIKED